MKRFRKEEKRKFNENIGGHSVSLGGNASNSFSDTEFLRKVQALHLATYPEDFDFMLDSSADLKMRKQGISPMSEDYLNRVNFRRVCLGVPEISGVDASISEES